MDWNGLSPWFYLAVVCNTLFNAGIVLGLCLRWSTRRLKVYGGDNGCPHCWHWLYTTRMGTVLHQHCCRCGHLRATHVVDASAVSTLRVGEHGQYIEFQSERDVVPALTNNKKG